jgi:hypothetical protein
VKTQSRGDGRVAALDLTEFGEEVADTSDVGFHFWELLNAELGPDKAHELACALVFLARQPKHW